MTKEEYTLLTDSLTEMRKNMIEKFDEFEEQMKAQFFVLGEEDNF